MPHTGNVTRYELILRMMARLFLLDLMDGQEFIETTESLLENPPKWLVKQKRDKTLADLLERFDRDFLALPEN